jgi:hypothetical protein
MDNAKTVSRLKSLPKTIGVAIATVVVIAAAASIILLPFLIWNNL